MRATAGLTGLLAGLSACLTLLAVPAAAAPTLAGPAPPLELERFVDGVVADGMATDHVAGVTVSIVQGGRVVLVKGYGQSSPGRPVDAQRDLFRIGSISKSFTWIALMREVEKGRVRLDAPVNDYLPPDMKIPDQGFKHPIRVLDLMGHSTGFAVAERSHIGAPDPARILPLAEEIRSHRPDRVREPGLFSSYSNYAASLAGLMVARLEGVGFENLIERDLTGPLGMTSTTFREPYPTRAGLPAPMPAALAVRGATGFLWKDGGYKPMGFEYISQNAPAGSASTTAPDMARYMQMLLAGGTLDGVRVFGPQTAAAFRTPIMHAPEGVNGWAHGFMIRPLSGGHLSYGHGGSLDRFYSNMSLIPDFDLGVFVSTNTSTGKPLTERLPKLIVERFYAPAALQPGRAGDPALVSHAFLYEGRYITSRRAFSGLEELADLLESHDRVWVSPKGFLHTRLDGTVRTWVPDNAPGRFVDAYGTDKLTFTLDGDGRARWFPFPRGTYAAERAGLLLNETLFRVFAVLALATAVATGIAAVVGMRKGGAPGGQRRFDAIGLAVAAAWLAAFGAVWRSGLLEGSIPDGDFPGPWLLAASWSAVLAAAGSLILAAAYLLALRGPRGEAGWRLPGTLGRGAAACVFLVFAVLLGAWGGLAPWA